MPGSSGPCFEEYSTQDCGNSYNKDATMLALRRLSKNNFSEGNSPGAGKVIPLIWLIQSTMLPNYSTWALLLVVAGATHHDDHPSSNFCHFFSASGVKLSLRAGSESLDRK